MTDKTFKVYPKAEEDLTRIYQYTQQEWGVQQAEAYIRTLHQGLMVIASNPALGRNRDYIRPGLKAYHTGSHIVFYKSTPYGVAIVRVLHQAMDYDQHFN